VQRGKGRAQFSARAPARLVRFRSTIIRWRCACTFGGALKATFYNTGQGLVSTDIIYLTTIWAIPVIVAITFHEAAHGFVAHFLATIPPGGWGASVSIR
jgi:hypothetical protein